MRRNNDSLIGAIVGLGMLFAWIVLCVSLALLKVWLIGSLITSAVKTAKDDCGKRYGIEALFSGNWFCPTETPKQSSNDEQADIPVCIAGSY